MRRRLASAALLLALALSAGGSPARAQAPASPSPAPSPTAPADGGPCNLPGVVDGLCDGVVGVIGSGVGSLAASGADAALRAVVGFFVQGAAWLLGQLTSLIDRSTRPEVGSAWFGASYARMTTVAVFGVLPFFLLAVTSAVWRRDLGAIGRALACLPVAALGTGMALVVVDTLVTVTDGMSAFVASSLGTDLTEFSRGLQTAVVALESQNGMAPGGVVGAAALLGAVGIMFTAFAIWVELLLRQAAVYVAVLFLPLGFMALVWPATSHWARRLAQGLTAVILSKFVIVSVLALAGTAINSEVEAEGYATVVSGAAMLLLAALAPYVLLRLIPVFDADSTGALEGTLRRPTAAVASPASGSSPLGQMLRHAAQAPRSVPTPSGQGGAEPGRGTPAPGGAAAGGPSGGLGAGSIGGPGGSSADGSGATPASAPTRVAAPTTAVNPGSAPPAAGTATQAADPPEPSPQQDPPGRRPSPESKA